MFMPVLPTTPFLTLAAVLFLRSSDRFHTWLVEHPRLGPYVRDFTSGLGIPAHVKRRAVVALWANIALSLAIVFALSYAERGVDLALEHLAWLAPLLVGIAALVTVYILTRPTCPPDASAVCRVDIEEETS